MFQKSISKELSPDPLWLMWKYCWIHKPDSERLIVHSLAKQNDFIRLPRQIEINDTYQSIRLVARASSKSSETSVEKKSPLEKLPWKKAKNLFLKTPEFKLSKDVEDRIFT